VGAEDAFEQIKHIAATYPAIKQMLLFGSRARGTLTRTSDIDFCVVCEDDRAFINFTFDMEEIDTIYKIDVVRFNTITNALLLDEIQRDKVVLYERGFK